DGVPFFAKSADGNPVLTDKRLSLYASWFENQLSNVKNCATSRLSGGGLAIKGLKTVCVDDILALPVCRAAIKDRIQQVTSDIFEKWNAAEAHKTRAARYETAYSALVDGLHEALNTAQSVLRGINGFEHTRYGVPRLDTLLKQIEAANAALLQSEIKDAAGFLLPASAPAPQTDDIDGFLSLTKKTYRDFAESLSFTLSALTRQCPGQQRLLAE
ncbi:MAG: hypothetical protein LBP37_02980, partial [Spirochaetaceae bacterium]|nr:hypothetical protein [Spirochaetaceae bacterium]